MNLLRWTFSDTSQFELAYTNIELPGYFKTKTKIYYHYPTKLENLVQNIHSVPF